MTKTLQVSGYTRKAPRDPYEDVKAATNAKLRDFVAVMNMEREIERIVKRDLETSRVRVPAISRKS